MSGEMFGQERGFEQQDYRREISNNIYSGMAQFRVQKCFCWYEKRCKLKCLRRGKNANKLMWLIDAKMKSPRQIYFAFFIRFQLKQKKANFHYGEFILNIEEPNYNIGKFERQNFYYVYAWYNYISRYEPSCTNCTDCVLPYTSIMTHKGISVGKSVNKLPAVWLLTVSCNSPNVFKQNPILKKNTYR